MRIDLDDLIKGDREAWIGTSILELRPWPACFAQVAAAVGGEILLMARRNAVDGLRGTAPGLDPANVARQFEEALCRILGRRWVDV